MQAIVGLSRGISRALVQGVVQRSQGSTEASQRAGSEEADSRLGQYYFFCKMRFGDENKKLTPLFIFSVTAVSGFPKPGSHYNIDNILKGQIGDDAYFVARHVDEWTTSDFEVATAIGTPQTESEKKGNADVIGVADGVGGWRAYGVDPGQFSVNLMKNCERLVKAGYFVGNQPSKLLEQVGQLSTQWSCLL